MRDSDSAHVFEDGAKMKIPSEISPPLQPDDDNPDFEPTCVPTDCKKDETRYFGSCVPVPICDIQDFVLFVDNLTTNSTTTRL